MFLVLSLLQLVLLLFLRKTRMQDTEWFCCEDEEEDEGKDKVEVEDEEEDEDAFSPYDDVDEETPTFHVPPCRSARSRTVRLRKTRDRVVFVDAYSLSVPLVDSLALQFFSHCCNLS